ncbi:MAG: hypothetical protein ACYCPS_06605, partial [Candidatus Saccharimonadales bacterium]
HAIVKFVAKRVNALVDGRWAFPAEKRNFLNGNSIEKHAAHFRRQPKTFYLLVISFGCGCSCRNDGSLRFCILRDGFQIYGKVGQFQGGIMVLVKERGKAGM